uniref:LRAT domain-containing protein n=1 Tax=Ditylenchus dipsaci TaxID=166011 RepID=A0A915CWQ5_9BILA
MRYNLIYSARSKLKISKDKNGRYNRRCKGLCGRDPFNWAYYESDNLKVGDLPEMPFGISLFHWGVYLGFFAGGHQMVSAHEGSAVQIELASSLHRPIRINTSHDVDCLPLHPSIVAQTAVHLVLNLTQHKTVGSVRYEGACMEVTKCLQCVIMADAIPAVEAMEDPKQPAAVFVVIQAIEAQRIVRNLLDGLLQERNRGVLSENDYIICKF